MDHVPKLLALAPFETIVDLFFLLSCTGLNQPMHRIVSKKERTGCASSARDQRVPVTVITGSLGSGKTVSLTLWTS